MRERKSTSQKLRDLKSDLENLKDEIRTNLIEIIDDLIDTIYEVEKFEKGAQANAESSEAESTEGNN